MLDTDTALDSELSDLAMPRLLSRASGLSGSLNWMLLIPVAGLLAVYPLVDSTLFGLGRLELAFTYMMAAIALNFVFGYGGELAVGQPAMLTAAGYTAGILGIHHGWGFWITTPIAVVVSVVISVFMGLPALRVRGWYLGVVGFLGVAIVPNVVNAFYKTTGGTDGLPGVPPIRFFGDSLPPAWIPYELILGLTVLFWFASRNLVASGWGTTLLSYRDHPYAAVASGINPMRLRAVLYVLSGIPCGVAGSLFANSQQFISASNFGTQTVLLLLGSVLLGGRGTNWGPVFGVAIFAGINLWLGPFSLYNPLILAIGVLVAALVFKGGIIGSVKRAWRRYGRSQVITGRLLETELASDTEIAPIEHRPHLEVNDVAKHFAGNYALQDVSVEVAGGSVVTVVGPNGSGKTTLLNCVSGFVKPDRGRVTLDGRNLVGLPNHRRAHFGLARTFQVPRLVEELTVRENTELGYLGLNRQSVGGAIFRLPGFRRRRRAAAERAIAACRELGLGERATQIRVEELPLAVRRLVEIARALAAGASVICLDEPVAGLNEAEQKRVASVLRAIASSGRAVLLIEHNLPFVLEVSDRLVLLRDGRIVDEGVPVDVKDKNRPLGEYFHTFTTKTDHIDRLEARL